MGKQAFQWCRNYILYLQQLLHFNMKNILKEREFLIIIAVFSVLRILAVAFMGLMPQDAYYTYYSDNLALSYFDHPPMVAYMIRFFLFFLGKSALALHIADFMVTTVTISALYLFIKQILSGTEVKRALILFFTAPLATILSINTTPDVPLMFFWSLTLLFAYNAIDKDRWFWWLLAGLSSGFAFDSKYTAVFLPAGLFLFLLLSKEHRRYIVSYRFVLFSAAFLAAIFPVVLWNIQNDFISLRYQSADRASGISSFEFDPALFPGFFFSQMLLALPLFFLSLYASGYLVVKKYFKGESIAKGVLFAASFALPMLWAFTAISFVYWVKINWIMPVFLSATVLAAQYLKNDKAVRYQTIFSGIAHLALLVQLVWMPMMIKSDDTWFGWKELAQKVDELEEQNPDDFFFSDNSYKISAVLNFYSDEHIYAGNVIDKFAFQFALDNRDLSHLDGQDAIYVTSERYRRKNLRIGSIESMLEKHFESAQLVDSLVIRDRDGDIHRKFYFYDCDNYQN